MATLTGDNGLLTKAGEAKNTTIESEGLEKIQLAVLSAQMKNKNLSEEILNTELQETFNNDKTVIESPNYYIYKTDKSYRIYKDGKVEEGNLLPDEFKQVEYIESTGTQYIDTKFKPQDINNLRIYYKATLSENGYFTGFLNNNYDYYGFRFINGTNPRWHYGSKYDDISFIYNNNQYYEILIDAGKFYIDNTLYSNLQCSNTTDYNLSLFLFARNTRGAAELYTTIKLKAVNIEYNNIIMYNFIPCKCTQTVINVDGTECQNGTAGLYDTVEGKFYTNQENGDDFVVGPDV